MTASIKLSLKGLAKYVACSPAAQRKILQDFKYPAADQPFAMKLYYREAVGCLKEYIRERHSNDWLRERATQLAATRDGQSAVSARRLRQNAEAVLRCQEHFRGKDLEVLGTPMLRLVFSQVEISVVADLCLRDRKKTKFIKLQFGGTKLAEPSVKVITHCMLLAANSNGYDLLPSSAVYVDLPRGVSYTAPRGGKRTLNDIRAACETISQVWNSIPPPAKPKRSAAA